MEVRFETEQLLEFLPLSIWEYRKLTPVQPLRMFKYHIGKKNALSFNDEDPETTAKAGKQQR